MGLLTVVDKLAETSDGNGLARFLDRAAFVFLCLMIIAAPHSIAATQGAWLLGMLAWILRFFVQPRPTIRLSLVGIALVALFVWSVVSAFFSYEPVVSIDKLRAVAVFLIFIYALNLIRSRRTVYFLAFMLIGSCMISVLWTPAQKIIGRGVEVHGVVPNGALAELGVKDGDTLLRVDGRKIGDPAEVIAALQTKPSVQLLLYRPDYDFGIELSKESVANVTAPEAALGFASWKRSSTFRSAGFYGHYTTFAEVLQLIGALAFGLFVAAFMRGAGRRWQMVLAFCVAAIAFALLLTVTRASQLAFVISSVAIVFLGASRRVILVSLAMAVPVAAIGLYVLQHQRGVGFFDSSDGSIQYRLMMWRDGVRLITENPRHAVVGVGMESIKTHWQEWRLFDNGHQPMGHFHSTPVQFAVERGIPALILWLVVLGVYARTLWRGFRSDSNADWRPRGILLGCLGALIGFFASGLVHYNIGDQEVAMVFYILMAFGVALASFNSSRDTEYIPSRS